MFYVNFVEYRLTLIKIVQIPRALLEAGTKINTETTLSIAAGYGDLEIVKILLERGSNVNQPDRQALERAREEWEAEINPQVDAKLVEHFGVQGALAVYTSSPQWNSIHREISDAKWRKTTMDNIMYLSRVHPDLDPPIVEAARNGHHEIVALLLENGAEVDIIGKEDKTGKPKSFATLVAVRAGHLEVVRTLLKHGALVDGPLRPEKPYYLQFSGKYSILIKS